jgi:hypothetical protein
LCNADGASSDGAPSFLMVVALDQVAHISLLLVALILFWWLFIRWRTALSVAGGTFRRRNVLPGAGDALLYGTPSLLMLAALLQMAHLHFWCWWLFLDGAVLCGGSGASSDGAPSFLVVAVVVVALYQMTQSLVRWWRRFIRWRTFFLALVKLHIVMAT